MSSKSPRLAKAKVGGESSAPSGTVARPVAVLTVPSERKGLTLSLHQAGLRISPAFFLSGVTLFAGGCGILSTLAFSLIAFPLFAALGAWLPFAWLGQRIKNRALAFSLDYPAVLLATASSVQVGLTPHHALLRATRLLPPESVARREVELLLKRLNDGEPKDLALQRFADAYAVPDVELFRSAFLLVTETGGRFSPTLQRLAAVSNNRMALVKMAGVTTASMRMTANVLLCIAPALLFFLSTRIEGYWYTFRNHPTANLLASMGVLMIAAGYLTLRKMSSFKP